jgi:hypothetical protein
VERFTGGTEMERSGDGLNWRSQAPRAGAATRERFSRVEGKSVLVSRAGNPFRFVAIKMRQKLPLA